MGCSKLFTPVPLAELDRARRAAKAQMAEIYKATGVRLRMRTFFVGPRPKSAYQIRFSQRPASTLKTNAVAAKLAFYKATGSSPSGFVYYSLIGYY